MFQKDGSDASVVDAAMIVCDAFLFAAPLAAYAVSILCAFSIGWSLARPPRNVLAQNAPVRHHDPASAEVAASEPPYDPRWPLFDPHAFTLWCRQHGEGVEPITKTRLVALASEYCEFTGRCRPPAPAGVFQHVKAAGWRSRRGRRTTYSIAATDTAAEAEIIVGSAQIALHAAKDSEEVVAVLRCVTEALARLAGSSSTETDAARARRQAPLRASKGAQHGRVPAAVTILSNRHAPVLERMAEGVGGRLQLASAVSSRNRSPP